MAYVNYTDFNIEDVRFDEIRVMENKSKSVGIRYLYTDENGVKSVKPLPLKIMLPEMKTWGASESSFNPGDWSMSMQITESTPVEVVAIFEALDNRIVDYVFENQNSSSATRKAKKSSRNS